jgi:AcrR family transcriptional regulator
MDSAIHTSAAGKMATRINEAISKGRTPRSENPGKRAMKPPPAKPGTRKTREANSLAPQQERSRESLRKLMKAAAEVLGQHGVKGATIPRIAAHAGLTPGAIYRRFSDKDALLESVILGIFERQDERLRTGLTQEIAGQIPLPVFAEQIVHSLLVSYRANAGLLRAMRQFVQSRMSTEFWKKIARLEKRSYGRLIELLLTNAQDIRHPEPRIAVSLGMTMVISTLQEVVLNTPDTNYWKDLLPKNDQALRRELTQALLSYLGVNRSN